MTTDRKYKKGDKSRRGPGRPKGTPNKTTVNAREAIAFLVDGNVSRMQGWLDRIAEEQGPLAAWKCINDVIEFHIPRLARSGITGKDGGAVVVQATATDERL